MTAHEAQIGQRRGARIEENLLSAVVCPLILRELPQALINIRTWNDELQPGPPQPGQTRPRLIFSFNCAPDADAERSLREAFAAAPLVREAFADLDIRFLALPEEKDQYVRNPTGPAPKYGFKSGPNWMFYETIKALRDEARFVFLMEVDCVPLVTNWLRKLSRACARHDDAWVVGAHYSGASPLLRGVARHINGNALYNVGDSGFAVFLDEILWPWMLGYIEAHDPSLAYDCAWEVFLNREEMEYTGHYDWIVSRNVLHKFRLTDTIINIGGHAEQSGHYVWRRQQLLKRFPSAAIAHGPVSTTMAHRRGSLSVGNPSLTGATLCGDAALSLDGVRSLFLRSIWPASGPFEPAQTVTISFTMTGRRNQVIAIGLREPGGRILERKKVIITEDGQRKVRVEFNVPHRLNYLNIALMILRQAPEPAAIEISELVVAVAEGENVSRIKDFAKI